MSFDDREGDVLKQQVAQQARARRQEYFGVYRGKVTAVGSKSSGQEDVVGQLQIQVPAVWGDRNDNKLPWAHPCFAFAGDQYGLLMLPQVGDGVWVMFEAGLSDRPMWLGGWWTENHKRPDPAGPDIRVVVTPHGHKLILDDKNDELRLEHAKGTKITVAENEITLEVNGGSKIVVGKASVKINDIALEVMK
jgi:uncharacterized protein involved in type VI secretion and phage assembly